MPSQAAADILKITGHDVSGFRTLFESRQAEHIERRHGIFGKADKSMSDHNDVARIQYVLDNYDGVVDGGNTNAYREPSINGRQKYAPIVVFYKKVNGTYYVIEATPVTNKKAVQIVSAYILELGKTPFGNIGKKITRDTIPQVPDANAPGLTADTAAANNVSVDNISSSSTGVNQLLKIRLYRAIQTKLSWVIQTHNLRQKTPYRPRLSV